MIYQSTKTYGPELGLSAVFRQWRADSHCNKLHGYALGFKFTFEAEKLDDRNWVMDFGNLKGLKFMLQLHFDHKLVVAEDDPELDTLLELKNIADVVVVEAVGCEKFAELAYEMAVAELENLDLEDRIRVVEVECFEHGANSAIYRP